MNVDPPRVVCLLRIHGIQIPIRREFTWKDRGRDNEEILTTIPFHLGPACGMECALAILDERYRNGWF
jgi:hypothetical protein